ncbi:ATP-binding protein [Bacillus suaedaesalsae]|uniref:histidine kinase n=1 Tax=Bacillus suaedaesalsae TaxID=2810349 RepID=A0ABS2DMA5_9BACI|nr:ATP-binding protein [Bacillus suaedaesalsae]MBM6619593.1 PAS domain S-box protein [Bacillus suaedaesalsae]
MKQFSLTEMTRNQPFILFCSLMIAAFITLLFLLLVFDIEISNQFLYLVIIPYFIISSMFSIVLHSILEKKSNKERVESDQRYKSLIENHPDGVIIHHMGTILYANPAIYEMLGYPYGSATGQSLLQFAHPSTHEKIHERQREAYAAEAKIQEIIEVELVHQNGSSIFAESKAIGCMYNDKKCVQLVVRDVTERKKAEEMLKASDRLAVVGQLAAGIAHEIRNPLTSIKGFVQVMKESNSDSEYYDVILSEIDRINEVTNDFLFLAKPKESQYKQCLLYPIIHDIATLLGPEALYHNIQMDIHDKTTQNVFILCEENELKQAFINIVKNSIEAMPTGGKIEISLQMNEENIEICFEDNGMGIPKDKMKNIGQPFYTLKETGTGLGVMTTMKIIENHQGIFSLQSEEGKGTTITVCFPVALKSTKGGVKTEYAL